MRNTVKHLTFATECSLLITGTIVIAAAGNPMDLTQG